MAYLTGELHHNRFSGSPLYCRKRISGSSLSPENALSTLLFTFVVPHVAHTINSSIYYKIRKQHPLKVVIPTAMTPTSPPVVMSTGLNNLRRRLISLTKAWSSYPAISRRLLGRR